MDGFGIGCDDPCHKMESPLYLDSIFVAYPYDERSLIVERSGHAELSRRGVKAELRRRSFDVDDLFQLLMFYWEPLREGEPAAPDMRTVRVFYNNQTSGT